MVAARRRVLDSGVFAPLAEAVVAIVAAMAAHCTRDQTLRVIDAGCGEGYYLAGLFDAARTWSCPGELSLAGFDISKYAVRAAARRCGAVAWAVASNRQPPFAAASIDIVLSLFGFPHWAAFERVLAPGGCVVLIDAGAAHLLELRACVYPQVKQHSPRPLHAAVARGWRVRHEQTLEYQIDLTTPAAIEALFAMTPHAHRVTDRGRAALGALDNLRTTVSSVLRVVESPIRVAAEAS